MEELERAVTAGKIRAIGVSNYPLRSYGELTLRCLADFFSTQTASAFCKRGTLAVARHTG